MAKLDARLTCMFLFRLKIPKFLFTSSCSPENDHLYITQAFSYLYSPRNSSVLIMGLCAHVLPSILTVHRRDTFARSHSLLEHHHHTMKPTLSSSLISLLPFLITPPAAASPPSSTYPRVAAHAQAPSPVPPNKRARSVQRGPCWITGHYDAKCVQFAPNTTTSDVIIRTVPPGTDISVKCIIRRGEDRKYVPTYLPVLCAWHQPKIYSLIEDN